MLLDFELLTFITSTIDLDFFIGDNFTKWYEELPTDSPIMDIPKAKMPDWGKFLDLDADDPKAKKGFRLPQTREEMRKLLESIGLSAEEIEYFLKIFFGDIVKMSDDEINTILNMIQGLSAAVVLGIGCGSIFYCWYSMAREHFLQKEAIRAEKERAYLEELTDKIIEMSQEDPRFRGVLPDNPENPFRKK